jgi:hypothetical protein
MRPPQYNPSQDFSILRTAASDLQQYLLSPVLYWPVEGGSSSPGQAPRLTPGNLLLAQARLNVLALPAQQTAERARLNSQVDEIRTQWVIAWQRKAASEFSARLNLWNEAVKGLASSLAQAARLYSQDVRWRVMLELLLTEGGESLNIGLLVPVDARLRAFGKLGPFVWPPEVETAFSFQRFWFLYLSFPT